MSIDREQGDTATAERREDEQLLVDMRRQHEGAQKAVEYHRAEMEIAQRVVEATCAALERLDPPEVMPAPNISAATMRGDYKSPNPGYR